MPERLMTVAEFGRALDPQLTPAAVRANIATGRIRVAMRTRGGMRLLDPAEAVRFQAEREARRALKAAA